MELVDCDKAYNQGCNGGLMDYAFQFIIKNGGVDTEADYLYKEKDDQCDRFRKNANVVSIDDYEDVPENDEKALQKAAAHQPISVAVEAGSRPFQLYKSGILSGTCGTSLDHGVTVVGYVLRAPPVAVSISMEPTALHGDVALLSLLLAVMTTIVAALMTIPSAILRKEPV